MEMTEEKDMDTLVKYRIRMTHQYSAAVKKADPRICQARYFQQREREVLMSLYKALVRPHLDD